MAKIRLCAALWAMMTIILSFGLYALPGGSALVSAAMTAASLCLALVSPAHAGSRAARTRVALGCVVYSIVMFATVVLAHFVEMHGSAQAMIVLCAMVGLVLGGWAWATRNRRPKPGWSGYYDRP